MAAQYRVTILVDGEVKHDYPCVPIESAVQIASLNKEEETILLTDGSFAKVTSIAEEESDAKPNEKFTYLINPATELPDPD